MNNEQQHKKKTNNSNKQLLVRAPITNDGTDTDPHSCSVTTLSHGLGVIWWRLYIFFYGMESTLSFFSSCCIFLVFPLTCIQMFYKQQRPPWKPNQFPWCAHNLYVCARFMQNCIIIHILNVYNKKKYLVFFFTKPNENMSFLAKASNTTQFSHRN